MTKEGPELNYLLHRMADCPQEFLNIPYIPKANSKEYLPPENSVNTLALLSDLISNLGGSRFTETEITEYRSKSAIHTQGGENFLKLVQICIYLFSDTRFDGKDGTLSKIKDFLQWETTSDLYKLSALVEPEKFITEAERREEIIRLCLSKIDFRPKGESEIQSKDRLNTISSIERARVLEETKKSAKKAEALRKKLEEQAAIEAASKMPRE